MHDLRASIADANAETANRVLVNASEAFNRTSALALCQSADDCDLFFAGKDVGLDGK